MGYYIETIRSKFHVSAENFDAAYQALCELNSDEHEREKTGGNSSAPELQYRKPTDSTSISSNPNKWYAWMDWNYDETCPNLTAILKALGFTVDVDETGITGISYEYAKTGNEETFLKALAPYVEPDSFIVWCGEEGEEWVDVFDGKTMTCKNVNYEMMLTGSSATA